MNDRLKVLQIIPSLKGGGAEKLVMQMHLLFLERGISSHIISFTGDCPLNISNMYSLNLSYPRSVKGLFYLALALRKFVRKYGVPDVIHTHLFTAQLFTPLALVLLRLKTALVTTEHSTNNRRRNTFLGKMLDKRMYKFYDAIICISDGVASSLQAWQRLTKQKLTIVHNGIDLKKFNLRFQKLQIRRGRVIIISVGSLRLLKGYKIALRAISSLAEQQIEYWIVGDGPEKRELENLAGKYGIADRVKFLGWRDDIPELLQKADIFLLTSRWEGFGLVVVEAMAAGLPVVVSDVPGVDEVVGTDGLCGYLVDPQDVEGFAKRIKTLIHSNAERRRLGKNAVLRAQKFSIEETAQKYISLYKRLCGSDS